MSELPELSCPHCGCNCDRNQRDLDTHTPMSVHLSLDDHIGVCDECGGIVMFVASQQSIRVATEGDVHRCTLDTRKLLLRRQREYRSGIVP